MAEPFDNVSIIKLPPYSPELNPIEQVWSGLRQPNIENFTNNNKLLFCQLSKLLKSKIF
ncbi:transposase [Vibrio vulnificus]|nr:transposase [Vibrio vulnificus]MCD1421634.1 transposase [Vibrio vulnificus]